MKNKTTTEQAAIPEEKESYTDRLRNHAALHLLAAMVADPRSKGWTNEEMVGDSVHIADLLIAALSRKK
jgi:hypothetical protein